MLRWKPVIRINLTLLVMCSGLPFCYLNIASYQWYKNNITTGGTIYLLFVLCVVISSTIANPFRMGTENIRNCTVSLIHMHSMMIYNLVWESFVSCCT
ncbi:Uncharacterized protein APZ42_023103 [Daphnia magna]|uniref:Uncharacterized protein n=1 Tax=Daphnia magna TaxID=35525 RepID=A0A164V6N1_9CRUS|nr:Uncharacterized protein APZ42_023103 [Daphnia magna]